MADKEDAVKKLGKYIPLETTEVGAGFPSRSTKAVSAMDAADLAEGKTPGTANKDAMNMMVNSRDMNFSNAASKEAAVDKKLQKVSELADQYKRETTRGVGVKDNSLRGKIRDVTGMKQGGAVRSASSRADGIAQRGKTRA